MAILKDGLYGQTDSEIEHPAFWRATLQTLQTMTTPDLFQVWIKPLRVIAFEDGLLTLNVPSAFFQTYIHNHFENKILQILQSSQGLPCRLAYVVDDNQEQAATIEVKNETITIAPEPVASAAHPVTGSGLIKTAGGYIDSRLCFENFIVGAGTQFAHAAALGVAMKPGIKHNPLLIFGPSGLGKTHLLHAIALQVLKNNPSSRICYLPAEKFVNDFIESTQRGSVNQFQNRYRSRFDVFLIDDIQFFGGKNRSQEEFFHTFNYLYSSRNQVIMTSDKPPKDLSGLEERLITRLQQGLVVDVRPPDLETRIAILRAKAEADDIYLPEDVCLFIASNIRSNVRELEGALVRIAAEASINGTEVTIEMARAALSDTINGEAHNDINMESITKCVSQYFKISVDEMYSKSREKRISEPRHIAMYLCRKYTNKTLPEIGELFGKDHTTVIHAINKLDKEILDNSPLKKRVEEIQQLL